MGLHPHAMGLGIASALLMAYILRPCFRDIPEAGASVPMHPLV
jgi:hypothetical protein